MQTLAPPATASFATNPSTVTERMSDRAFAEADAAYTRWIRSRAVKNAPRELLPSLMADAWGHHSATAQDFADAIQRAHDMGAAHPQYGPAAMLKLYRRESVPNFRFREAVLRIKAADAGVKAAADGLGHLSRLDGRSVDAVAVAMGYTRPRSNGQPHGDTTRIERLLGIQTQPPKDPRWKPSMRTLISYADAVRLADVLTIPYHDLGL